MVSPSYGIQGSELIQKVTDGIRAVGTPILGSDKRWESAQWLLLIASLTLLALEHTSWRFPLNVGFLVPLIFLNAPQSVFEFIRHDAGHWIGFFIILYLIFSPTRLLPPYVTPAIILLIVVAPSFIVNIRYSVWGVLISFVIALIFTQQHVGDAQLSPDGPRSALTHRNKLPTTIAILVVIIVPVYFFISTFYAG